MGTDAQRSTAERRELDALLAKHPDVARILELWEGRIVELVERYGGGNDRS